MQPCTVGVSACRYLREREGRVLKRGRERDRAREREGTRERDAN
jgi:hypothetical protein